MKFQKGQTGNPGGRPRGAAGLAAYIQEQTQNGEELIDRLLMLSRGKNVREATAATLALLDRGFGRAVSTSIHLSPQPSQLLPENFDTLSPEQKEKALDVALERQAALAAGKP